MVQIKRKVTLKKKTAEPIETASNSSLSTSPNNKHKGIIGGIVALVLLVVVILMFVNKDNSEDQSLTIAQTVVENANEKSEDVSATPEDKDSQVVEEQETSPKPLADEQKKSDKATDSVKDLPQKGKSSIIKERESKGTTDIVSGSLEQKAKNVIRGDYGNGEERKQKLGNQYEEIQAKVNEMYRNGLVN